MCQAIQKKSGLLLTLINFGHSNIIKYCQRPFKNAEEMNEVLIDNWNSVVDKKDTVLHLGDFAFKQSETIPKILSRLNGKINILLGNHDNPIQVQYAGFYSVREGIWDFSFYDEERKEKRRAILCHYPMLSWRSSYHRVQHYFGHVHSGPYKNFFCQRNSYDVGVDNNDFKPILLTKIMNNLELKFNNSNIVEDMSEINSKYLEINKND